MKLKPITSLTLAVDLSVNGKVTGELVAKFAIEVEGRKWHVYTVAMGYKEFTCYCKEGTATFVVDTYGDRATCELYDWEVDA